MTIFEVGVSWPAFIHSLRRSVLLVQPIIPPVFCLLAAQLQNRSSHLMRHKIGWCWSCHLVFVPDAQLPQAMAMVRLKRLGHLAFWWWMARGSNQFASPVALAICSAQRQMQYCVRAYLILQMGIRSLKKGLITGTNNGAYNMEGVIVIVGLYLKLIADA